MAGMRNADGYTISQMPATVFRFPLMSRRPSFDPLTDFTYIIQLVGYMFGVVVRADAPWRTWQEFVTHAKANPDSASFSSPGIGTTNHLTMERIAEYHGIQWLHVPFRGSAESLQGVLSGNVMASADSAWGQLVADGEMRLLATWGPERSKRFPLGLTLD